MSKFFAAIMAFFMMILSWFGIGGGKTDKPDETEPATAVVTEATTAEETTAEETTAEETTAEESNVVRENPYRTDAAFGCAYIKDREPHENYPDTFGTELTDGLCGVSASYANASHSGYTGTWDASLKVDIELDEIRARLYSFEVSYLATNDAGINIPSGVAVFISEDGAAWTKIGNASIPSMEKGTVQRAVLTLDEYVSANYVRFAVSGTAAFVFLDELFVYSDTAPVQAQSFADSVRAAYNEYGAESAPTQGEPVDKTLSRISVSQGKSYELSGSTAAPFEDDGVKLTDGSVSNTYESGKYSALESAAGQSITVDFGENVADIAGAELEAYSRELSRIYLPCAVSFTAIAEDGTETPLGTRYAKLTNTTGVYTFSLELDYAVSARKIRAELAQTPCAEKFLIDEINIYAYREAAVTPPCYPPVKLSLEDNGEWDSSGADYNTYRNLLLGEQPQIITAFSFNDFQNEHNTPADSGLLTDGIHSTGANIYNGCYQIFYTCNRREVIFDIGKTAAVDKFVCEFTNLTSWAVYSPSEIKVYISENGCDWFSAGSVLIDTSVDNAVLTGELSFASPVRARYFCFEFAIKIFAGCSEIEAFGTENTENALTAEQSGMKSVSLFKNKRIEPSEGVLDGARDTCLLYHSKTFSYTPETLLPYVAYIDRNGNIADTMFDSFLFLISGVFPSGGTSFGGGKLTDWQWSIADLFAEGENILALEQAAGTAKEALGLPEDYVYPFTVAAYCPSAAQTAFGDIDGDGVNDDMSTVEARAKAICAYADMFEAKLSEYDFKNIKFDGYYWMNESMETANNDDEVARVFSAYVHSRDYDFIWIPYYNANGFDKWEDYGFDCAVLQPNYMFTNDIPLSRFASVANQTELYGLGIEIEVSSEALRTDEYYQRYMRYLSNGVKLGYMNDTISMYYQELLIYYNASRSEGGRARLLYENTYGYIKGTLDIYPESIPVQSLECEKNTIFEGRLTLPEGLWHAVTLASQPAHGTVTMNSDGSFSYYPEKDFTGTVEIKFTYTESFEQSEECVAVINVR